MNPTGNASPLVVGPLGKVKELGNISGVRRPQPQDVQSPGNGNASYAAFVRREVAIGILLAAFNFPCRRVDLGALEWRAGFVGNEDFEGPLLGNLLRLGRAACGGDHRRRRRRRDYQSIDTTGYLGARSLLAFVT